MVRDAFHDEATAELVLRIRRSANYILSLPRPTGQSSGTSCSATWTSTTRGTRTRGAVFVVFAMGGHPTLGVVIALIVLFAVLIVAIQLAARVGAGSTRSA